MKHGEFPMIELDELTDLSMLKSNVLYTDGYENMTKEEQEEIYHYCKLHATFKACQENLAQIRYAVARIYFGY